MKELQFFTSSSKTLVLFYLMILFLPKTIVCSNFLQCMNTKFSTKTLHIYTRDSSTYTNLLHKAQHNPRWLNTSANQPLYIITPSRESEIGAIIVCSKQHNLLVRIRSGGHDYEGLSYLSKKSFVLIDLLQLRSIRINMRDHTAWVQAGANLGELYYNIANRTNLYGFPAGTCPTVGLGGHISGGGFGTLTRKYGMAADHVVDARIVDVIGRVLDRKSMGEDLFWAIRGGGGASFGVITAWKLKLVPVPKIVTVFTLHRNIDKEGSKVIDKWQRNVANLHEHLFIRLIVHNNVGGATKIVQANFQSMFLGNMQSLIPLMKQSFPELKLEAKDCTEMSWIDSVLYFAGRQPRNDPREILLDRDHQLYKSLFKAKSDFVTQPIPETALKRPWDKRLQIDSLFMMIMEPLGGRMDIIPETQIAFPHRKGNLYNIQYIVKWDVNEDTQVRKNVRWIRRVHKYMTPYVSRNPRASYLNYRDLDLGINGINGTTSYSNAKVWGTRYFKNNFERLAKVKRSIDPTNFFRDEQSIPPFN